MLADRVLGIFLMAVSAALLVVTITFPFQASVYPSTVLVLIFLLSLSFVMYPQSKRKVTLKGLGARVADNKRVPGMLLAIFAFIALVEPLGFYIALPLFMLASQLIMGTRSVARLLLVAVFMTLLIYGIFSAGLGLNIPLGLLER